MRTINVNPLNQSDMLRAADFNPLNQENSLRTADFNPLNQRVELRPPDLNPLSQGDKLRTTDLNPLNQVLLPLSPPYLTYWSLGVLRSHTTTVEVVFSEQMFVHYRHIALSSSRLESDRSKQNVNKHLIAESAAYLGLKSVVNSQKYIICVH